MDGSAAEGDNGPVRWRGKELIDSGGKYKPVRHQNIEDVTLCFEAMSAVKMRFALHSLYDRQGL